jgi:hydroxymethylpyrimidine/phosphomethylpyrimidine kinase
LVIAAAIASNLAKGMEMSAAVKAACRYVQAGIRTAPGLGGGNGPLNHFHSVYTLPFSRYGGSLSLYLLPVVFG